MPSTLVHVAKDSVWVRWLRQEWIDRLAVTRMVPGIDVVDVVPPAGDLIVIVSEVLLGVWSRESPNWAELVAAVADRAVTVCLTGIDAAALPAALASLPLVDLAADEDHVRARLGLPPATGALPLRGDRVRFPGPTAGAPRVVPESLTEPRWFYGRYGELDAIRAGLATTGAVVLVGTTASGKTSLAKTYLDRNRSQYDLIAWVNAGNPTTLRHDLVRLAGPLGLGQVVGNQDAHRLVVQHLVEMPQRFLLVYDDARPDSAGDQQAVGSKPAPLAEVVPWGGNGHILFTSKVQRWQGPHTVTVPLFTDDDGARFLSYHVPELAEDLIELAVEESAGSPLLLHTMARRGREDAARLAADLREKAFTAPTFMLDKADAREYRAVQRILGNSLRRLIDAPAGSDERAAGYLLRLLAYFAPNMPIPLVLLEAEPDGVPVADTVDPGWQATIRRSLRDEDRRARLLELIRTESLADTLTLTTPVAVAATGVVLHSVITMGIQVNLSDSRVQSIRHEAHRILCAADPRRPDLSEHWERYHWLWRQLDPSGALACDRLGDPRHSCGGLLGMTGHIVQALRNRSELTASAALGERATDAWAPHLGADHIGIVRLRTTTGNVLWQMDRWERAHEIARRALAGVAPNRDRYPEEYTAASDLIAACLRSSGDWAGSVGYNEASYATVRAVLGPQHRETLRAQHNFAVAVRMMGRFAEALELDSAVYASRRDDPDDEDQIFALHSRNNVARDLRELGRYTESVRVQEEVVRDMLTLLGDPRQQHVLRAEKNLAVSYRKAGSFADGYRLQLRALDHHVAVYGPDHPESVAARTNLANDCRLLDRHDEALELAEEAYQRCAAVRPAHPYTAACAVNFAAALRTGGDVTDALDLDRQAVRIFTDRLGAAHPYTLAAGSGVAADLAGLGEYAEAVEIGAAVLARSTEARGADHPYTLQVAINYALDLRALGRVAEADGLEADALGRYRATLGLDHPDTAQAAQRRRGTCDIEPPPM
ncbi:FxSxx-COOH system tetratricopeptide repeat protein [Nocardia sp. NPDC060249]|uniref:FxSxx-COOH system tetratricopeptide repeat protein n=1 Tax=Nocardia sp. NPDC060249 TaxID=3347082 RepID=UPI003655EA3E